MTTKFEEILDAELLIDAIPPVLRGIALEIERIDADLQPVRDRVPQAMQSLAEAKQKLEEAAQNFRKRR